MRTLTRALVALLVVAVALTGASATGLASGGESTEDTTNVGSIDLVLEDEHVHVSDVSVSGDGLPTAEIDERTLEIESATIEADGVTVTVRGTTYEIGEFSVGFENVGVTLENVSIDGGNE